ncbi:MAG: hypothetical protein ACP5PT_01155 [Brevinematia bacterium]
MSYENTMYMLMYPIRHEFGKITSTRIIDFISNLSDEGIEKAISSFEQMEVSFVDLQSYVLNIPINLAKKFLKLVKDVEIIELLRSYMLYYEFYNYNTILRARLNGYDSKDIFLFDYGSLHTRDYLENLTSIDDIRRSYYEFLSYVKLGSKKFRDAVKIVSLATLNDVLLYSSIEYYKNLISKSAKFGSNLRKLVKVKSFYDLIIEFSKIKYLAGEDVEKYIEELSFLGDNKDILKEVMAVSIEGFIKKLIDKNILPSNFLITDIDDIARFRDVILKGLCKNIIIGSPLDPATIVAILILREIDVRNYLSILGGYVEGLSIERIRSLLVL